MKVVIMAGGRGTRISSIASDIPKPMIRINNIPVLEHELIGLRNQGFTDIIITVSHLGSIIMDYFGDGSGISPATGEPFGVNITYFNEETPLGNAGALFLMRASDDPALQLDDDFLLLNADVMFDIDFNRFVTFHRSHGGLLTLFTHPNSHPYDSSLIIAGEHGTVEQWLSKGDVRPEFYKNRVNAGLHIINPVIIDRALCNMTTADGVGLTVDKIGHADPVTGEIIRIDLDCQLLKPLVGTGMMYYYDSSEYVKDMGTPDRFLSVSQDVISGLVHAKNLRNRQKAIFLDRDGVMNKYVGFLRSVDDFTLLAGVCEAIRLINASGYLAIIITNQPVIARGEVTDSRLAVIHNKMETLLGREGAYLDGIYFCPHHPDRGYPGEIRELKVDCDCRKPKPGMLLRASADLNIDLSHSWMVGDGKRDIQCGQNAGCRTALIIGNGGESNAEDSFGQDVTVNSLLEFVKRYVLTCPS